MARVGLNFATRMYTASQVYWIAVVFTTLQTVPASLIVEEYTCFSQLFQIKCTEGELIVFETANYGRNDTHVAYQCGVPYKRTCDVDVTFNLNRVCAGKQNCNIAVNTALFGDPCGYEEFLRVKYRCVAMSTIHMACQSSRGGSHFDHGYIASPNYPGKYYMDAECFWKLSVQKRQTIRLTIFDYELDVKKGGSCSDYLEVYAGQRTYFKDCGSLGRQEIVIDSSDAVLRFKTGSNSLTQRGFFIYFEAIGPGCPDIEDLDHGHIEYFIENDILYANASCEKGFHFPSGETDFKQIRCSGSFWNSQIGSCIAIPPPTTPPLHTTTTTSIGTPYISKPSSVVGIALGVVSAILLITLLLVLALYFHRRRRNAERKLDLARVVINNLQEGEIADENYKNMNMNMNESRSSTPSCNLRKAKKEKRKKNNKEAYAEGDPMAGRNLLPNYTPGGYEDDEYIMDYADCYRDFAVDNTIVKTPESEGPYGYMTRKNSKRGNNYSLNHSRENTLDNNVAGGQSNNYELEDAALREKARARREYRHRRSKSGQWDPPAKSNRSLIYAPIPMSLFSPLPRRVLTQSAPDLMELLTLQQKSEASSAATSPGCSEQQHQSMAQTHAPPLLPPRPGTPRTVRHSSVPPRGTATLPSSTQQHATVAPQQYRTQVAPTCNAAATMPARSNSRGKIRC